MQRISTIRYIKTISVTPDTILQFTKDKNSLIKNFISTFLTSNTKNLFVTYANITAKNHAITFETK